MPKRNDIKTIMVLGSGPIVIGQACEFDYSGTQGCKALREEGYRIVLLNSNPATVMTDPGFSDRTYIEPVNIHMASAIIRQERPDAILPTLGGQTALNLAMQLHQHGVLEEYGVEMIGARPNAIELAENRQSFREIMQKIGLDLPKSELAHSVDEALRLVKEIGFPAIVRPSYTLGGTGGGIAYNLEEFREIARSGLLASPIRQVLVEESVLGWKEMELEVVRDGADNAIVVCGIENFDPMGVHTGDSITVAPIQTLSDVEYQAMRDDALAVVRAVGVDTGGCNVQFAIDPETGRRVIIEMNPRVSRSSALASKATGFPIARIAAKLAVGYRLDELKNDITGTSACFEPTVDYCVVKVPRFTFEKFDGAKRELGLRMQSVGETMALGGNFREALQKALRGLETGLAGLEPLPKRFDAPQSKAGRLAQLTEQLHRRGPERLMELYEALNLGLSLEDAHAITGIDPWFLNQIETVRQTEAVIRTEFLPLLAKEKRDPGEGLKALWRYIKVQGFSDERIARISAEVLPDPISVEDVRACRLAAGVTSVFRSVDTCAGEFEALTPYFYATYDATGKDVAHEKTVADRSKRSVMILGGGPNRIGQGIEFDYCCVQAAFTLKSMGITTIMVNSNPETVSTDFDTADRLYFEPLTVEDILAIYEAEKPEGLMIQFGGQTPLNLAQALQKAGVPILGTQPEGIALAEDRDACGALAEKLGVPQPASGMAFNEESACRVATKIGYPVMVRPSFVLGGRAMRIIHDEASLRDYVSGKTEGLVLSPESPILVDKFLEDAVEVDVDAVVDGKNVTIAAIMEHIEQAGIHSGDSCCSIPTHTLSEESLADIRRHTHSLGLALGTRGLLNMQFAVHRGTVFIIEANPRASRTVPFVSKAIGISVAGIATRVMAGETLEQLGFTKEPELPYFVVKEAVFPFDRFPGAVINLGPEMRSTGEVMGIDRTFGMAFLKSQSAANSRVPVEGNVILSVSDRDKDALVPLAARLAILGFTIYATPGTRDILAENGIASQTVVKIGPQRPHLLDLMRNGDIDMIVNTVSGHTSARDASPIRADAIMRGITLFTTITAQAAAVEGLETLRRDKRSVAPLQDYYAGKVC
ncbi:MAG: carbamoyl-phosphate synthase large subunit [Deltaproteobacteria bacterium]|nr:carbamoyl-phosphate synthase large subunit [Deltaproteobacteria bacterium]